MDEYISLGPILPPSDMQCLVCPYPEAREQVGFDGTNLAEVHNITLFLRLLVPNVDDAWVRNHQVDPHGPPIIA
jgi:hypothetical protein